MPNYCYGRMYIRGYAGYVDELVNILKADYSYYRKNPDGSINYSYNEWCLDKENFTHIPHFFRVFEAEVIDEVWNSGVYKCVAVDLTCAWSIFCCMFDGPYTYYNQFEKEHYNQHFGSTILKESKRLQLEIEIWSSEEGMGFQEHYKICSGILIKDEEFDNIEGIYFSEDPDVRTVNSYKEFKEKYGKHFPDVTRREYEKYCKYEEYLTLTEPEQTDFIPGESPIYMGNLVMCKIKER